jgi:ribonuclease VapC
MIVVDASAILAILLEEDDGERFAQSIMSVSSSVISASSVLECTIKMLRDHSVAMDNRVDIFLSEANCNVVPIELDQLAVARHAFSRYGKGMGHPAQLNFGDCFSYALAKTRDLPLLFKGSDFSQTDIVSAVPS